MPEATTTLDSPAILTTSTSPSILTPSISKPKTKSAPRRLKVKRRGAKVEEDEGEDEENKAVQEPTSDSDSDFSAAEDEDDEVSEGEPEVPAVADSKKVEEPVRDHSAAPVVDKIPTSIATTDTTLPAITLHPSWSDLPATGEAGSDTLPTLDFATLNSSTSSPIPASSSKTPQTSNDSASPLPSTSKSAIGPVEAKTKKAQQLAKREAKSAAQKAKDPVAWEIAEGLRKEKELERKKEKKERLKQRKIEAKVATQTVPAEPADVTPATPSDPVLPPPAAVSPKASSSQAPRPPKAPRAVVASRPSRTAANLASANNTIAPVDTLATVPLDSEAPPSTDTRPAQAQGPRPRVTQFSNTPQYVQQARAREDYSNRMATDPTFTPRVGKFHTHDERLAAPGPERMLSQFWRGRGTTGEFRGRGRGARGGFGPGRGGQNDPERGGYIEEHQKKVEKEVVVEGDDSDGDGWGRGEDKRTTRNANIPVAFPTISSWQHDGFEEQAAAPPRAAGGRGGFANRGGRGGNTAGSSAPRQQQLGEINPRFSHLPFHPQYRFPLSQVSAAAIASTTTSRPTESDSQLFEKEEGPKVVLRLPGAAASEPAEATTEPVVEIAVVKPEVPAPAPADIPVVEVATNEPQPEPAESVLYAADPDRLANSIPPSAYQQHSQQQQMHLHHQQQQQQQHQQQHQQQAYFRQAPPHLQSHSQPTAYHPQQQHYITRGNSPAYYPHYYSPEHGYPNMPSPGATPPPLFSSASPLFIPPRNSKIDIRTPLHKTALSAVGDTFAPRVASISSPYPSMESPRSSTGSPSLPYGYSYGVQGAGAETYDGGMMYYQQQQMHPQHGQGVYYDPYASNGGYPQHSQQQVDPAILSMGPGYYEGRDGGRGGEYYGQQQQQMMQQGGGSRSPVYESYGGPREGY